MKDLLIKEALSQYQTPFYLFDTDGFCRHIQQVKEVLGPRFSLCYAMKANPFLTGAACFSGCCIEVCSPGEYQICTQLSVPAHGLVLSGVSKSKKDLDLVAVYGGAHRYTVESPSQACLLEAYAVEHQLSSLPVLLRLSSGNQFGMDEQTLLLLASQWKQYPHLKIVGLQYYSGTQKKKPERLQKELLILDDMLSKLHAMGQSCEELEYGPGLAVTYFEGEQEVEPMTYLEQVRQMVLSLSFQGKIILELGRFLAASYGCFVTTITDLKETNGYTYAIVDGGSHHVNYYGQAMAMKLPPCRLMAKEKQINAQAKPVTVCGSLCTSADILVKQLPLADPQIGDCLIFEKTGAYSVTEGISLFLSRDLPGVLSFTKQDGIQQMRDHFATWQLNTACSS